ncbi:hypothetical protein ACPWSR_11915 [Alloiococcus sp. CFN-8]|uniref:hypothetical protein n=1 Tax=Alloiococcus sp. CFN-8 TaxID=3416081 RepID=UPI003CE9DFC8
MFSKRHDGRRVHDIDPFQRITPYIMKTRTDSQNLFNDDFLCDPLDSYINQKKSEGLNYNYMKIIIAAMVRTIALRPALNRFVMNGRIYTRPKIWVSFVIHRTLRDDSAGTTVKLCFEGTETLQEISEAVDKIVYETQNTKSNDTDKLAGLIMSIPGPLVKLAVNTIMFLDKHNMLPKAVINASPFHTSFFVTNLKSIGLRYIYHHVYEFGTTGIFIALGKEKLKAVPLNNEILEAKKVLTLGLVTDERFCDGLYFAKSMKIFRRCLRDPKILENALDRRLEDVK